MYPSQIIAYHVKPLPGFNASWVTEITQVQEKKFFIDEQRFGLYRFWHQHMIKEAPDGVEMTDIVSCKLPFGMIGLLFGGRLVRRHLKNIFDYRTRPIVTIFQ